MKEFKEKLSDVLELDTRPAILNQERIPTSSIERLQTELTTKRFSVLLSMAALSKGSRADDLMLDFVRKVSLYYSKLYEIDIALLIREPKILEFSKKMLMKKASKRISAELQKPNKTKDDDEEKPDESSSTPE